MASTLAFPAAAASPQSDADALAQKFIDGPKKEAKAVSKRKQLERLRVKELDALSEKLRKARERRSAQVKANEPKEQEATSGLRGFSKLSAPVKRDSPRGHQKQLEPQAVAVLLSLQPSERSSRSFEKSAEPIICFETRCFIGAGPGQRAVEMPRRQALGPTNTIAARAGACRKTTSCVFRSVPLLPAQAWLQPVDLGWVRHDRRKPVAIAADPTCRIEKQTLSCERTVEGPDYRLWLVPESVARRAGSKLLQQALKGGLRATRRQALLDRSQAQRGPAN
ncbi:MAG: hypothetical protein AAF709_16290 [Pseudomonadota bacterium]